jgi:ATP-binding cassette subfamily F protein uup
VTRSLLLSCEAVGKAYGTRSLFEELSFGLFEGDQVGLVGPNGAGNSTLHKILSVIESPDRVRLSLRGGVRVG